MNLFVLPAGPIGTNAYLWADPQRREAVLVDAPGEVWADVEPILRKQKCSLVELWLTHGHWDHTQGAAEIVRETRARVRGHADDRALFETPEIMDRFMGERMNVEPVRIDHWVSQGETFAALGVTVEVRHVPGHCPGNVLFYIAPSQGKAVPETARGGMAFVGDALFKGSIGRTDLPGGDFEQLARSIREQIYTLPGGTAVYPGHGPPTTVAEEMAGNPYVSA